MESIDASNAAYSLACIIIKLNKQNIKSEHDPKIISKHVLSIVVKVYSYNHIEILEKLTLLCSITYDDYEKKRVVKTKIIYLTELKIF